MAGDETKKESPETHAGETTDEDEDKEDVQGHSNLAQRPDQETGKPKQNDAQLNEAQANEF